MDKIKDLPKLDRPRERLLFHGADQLSDEDLLTVLMGGRLPNVLQYAPQTLAQMDQHELLKIKGVGTARAAILIATAEFSRRVKSQAQVLPNEQAYYEFVRPMLNAATQLQYLLLLVSNRRELLAFHEAGSMLPDISKLTALAVEAGATRVLLARNGWPAFSTAEAKYLIQFQTACQALHIICDGLMAVGPERYKMI